MSRMNTVQIERFFQILAERDPDPRTELHYTNSFTLLIAVLLSAQATDIGVNKATQRLFEEADDPQAMLALGEDHVRDRIQTIGLFRNKAKNVIKLCQILIDHHGGAVPDQRDALEALPGVGRKTANVILNEAFGQPTIAVDTHIFRLGNRTGMAPGKNPDAVERELLSVVPDRYLKGAHHWLILHGRYICKARKPACVDCAVSEQCQFPDKATT